MKNLVLVIGGTSGIGLETVNYLIKKKYNVISSGRKKNRLENINYIKVDVTSETSVENLFNRVKVDFGDINSPLFPT